MTKSVLEISVQLFASCIVRMSMQRWIYRFSVRAPPEGVNHKGIGNDDAKGVAAWGRVWEGSLWEVLRSPPENFQTWEFFYCNLGNPQLYSRMRTFPLYFQEKYKCHKLLNVLEHLHGNAWYTQYTQPTSDSRAPDGTICVLTKPSSSLAAVFLAWGNPHVCWQEHLCYNCSRTFRS